MEDQNIETIITIKSKNINGKGTSSIKIEGDDDWFRVMGILDFYKRSMFVKIMQSDKNKKQKDTTK